MDVLRCALRQNTEEKLFDRWICYAQNEMSFEEFKRKINAGSNAPQAKQQTEEEILGGVRDILNGRLHT